MAEKRKFKVLVPLVSHNVGDTISEDDLAIDDALTEEVLGYMLRAQVIKPARTAKRGGSNGSR